MPVLEALVICALLFAVTVPTWVAVFGVIALVLIAAHMLAGIFGPSPDYKIESGNELPANNSDSFLNLIESLVDAPITRTGTFKVLANGPTFYPAELDAIRNACRSVNLEAYIFQRSEIGKLYLDALTDRARAGVRVNVVLDAFGSAGVSKRYFSSLLEAGGKVAFYNSPTWYRLLQLDNRTHRELLVVDGSIGFIGGAGVGDHWYKGVHGHPRWRDSMLCVEGGAVPSLQATFAENWLSATGELLAGSAYFPAVYCQSSAPIALTRSSSTPRPPSAAPRAHASSSSSCSPLQSSRSPSPRLISFPITASRTSSAGLSKSAMSRSASSSPAASPITCSPAAPAAAAMAHSSSPARRSTSTSPP